MLTTEQLEMRKKGLGGSDIAAICGISHYKTPFEVYLSKMGELEQKEETGPMEWGNRHEETIARKFAEKNDIEVIDLKTTFTHPENPILRCTPDRIVVNGKKEQLEIKTADSHIASRWGFDEDDAPQEYLIQVTWNSNILRACGEVDGDMNHLAVLIGGNDYRQYKVPHDQDLADMLVEKGMAWWKEHIEAKNPPEIDGSEMAQTWVRDKFPDSSKPMIASDDEMDALAVRWKEIRDDIKEKKLSEDAIKNKIRLLLGESEGVSGHWGKAYNRKSKDGVKIDYKGLIEKLDVPDVLLKQFTEKKEGTRALKPYFSKKGA